MDHVRQGEVIRTVSDRFDILVLSKDFFNAFGMAMVCPVVSRAAPDPLHIPVKTSQYEGIAMLEHLKSLDLSSRHYRRLDQIPFEQIQNISDAVQGIFDY